MRSHSRLIGMALGLCLLCAPIPGFAADAAPKAAPAKAEAPAAPAANATAPTGALTIVEPPITDIIITVPLILVERGTVASVDAKAGAFELKRKDGSLVKIQVTPHTVVENVYADIFTWESKKGLGDLKTGDRVRARVLPPSNGMESALLLDVFHF